MEHPESVTAVITRNEPPDGTKLVVIGEHESRVIWRDDVGAHWACDGDPDGQHWFDDYDEDPMTLHQHVKHADAVYVLGEPLAVFRNPPGVVDVPLPDEDVEL